MHALDVHAVNVVVVVHVRILRLDVLHFIAATAAAAVLQFFAIADDRKNTNSRNHHTDDDRSRADVRAGRIQNIRTHLKPLPFVKIVLVREDSHIPFGGILIIYLGNIKCQEKKLAISNLF